MDILKSLSNQSQYSQTKLQWIIGAWVLAGIAERKPKISSKDGDLAEEDYDKASLYSLLYSLYSSMGDVENEFGVKYEFTFNTWGYSWPDKWSPSGVKADDPQRFGKNAYTGLFQPKLVKDFITEKNGKVHIVEMGCGTGAGAHHICKNVLPNCTYEAVDMQKTAIETCKRKYVPELNGRLVATHANATELPVKDSSADFVVVNETHVTEMVGLVTPEDKKFFQTAHRILKPGGFLVWGNAIPTATWQASFDYLKTIGMNLLEVEDVTELAIQARDEDAPRANKYVEDCLDRFIGFRIPVLGARRRREAGAALKNFFRSPGTRLYENMKDRSDTYKVVLMQKG
ncbi:MAG TPA: class I SAM-dependent methyltransferase [Bacteroidia bacterium]